MTFHQKIDTLLSVRGALSASDQTFANSLCTQGKIKGQLSDKQMIWVDRLIERAAKPKNEPETKEIGSLEGVIALFEKARAHLQYPAIVLRYADGKLLRLNVAGGKAKVPGSVNVVDKDSKTWFGRIHRDGRFEFSIGNPPTAEVIATVERFAKDPAGVAAEHGKLTGSCCFCNTGLTDKRSTDVGYGPVCAKHFGLPWGHGAEPAASTMGWTASFGSSEVAHF